MAIDLTTLFVRLGKIGKAIGNVNVVQDPGQTTGVYAPLSDELMTECDSIRDEVTGVPGIHAAYVAATGSVFPQMQDVAAKILIRAVHDDNPAQEYSLQAALLEVRRQMVAQAQTVEKSVVACAASGGTQSGDAAVVISTRRGDGLEQENIVAEVATLVCTDDSTSGSATLGQEPFVYLGVADSAPRSDYNWPAGSGARTEFTLVDATVDGGTNMLVNGDFSDFTVANTPDFWPVVVGTPGTTILKSTAQHYSGDSCLSFVGGGLAASVAQQFGSATLGTAATLTPQRSYAFRCFLKVDVVPAAGVLTFELVDGNGAVINDSQSAANSTTKTLSAATTSWVSFTGVFRTPRVLPEVVKFRFRLSSGLSAGSVLFIDHLAMTPLTAAYPGGPGIALFSGVTPMVVSDFWFVTSTNSRGGETWLKTFQALWDRLFDMRGNNVLLASATSGAETIPDTYITA